MIPATFPSVLDSSNRTKMLVYQVPSITGLTRWVDYIPVKSPASESDLTLANTYANEGFILTSKVNDITGLVPFKDYVPIYLDSTATKAWSADNDGYIPMSELAGLLLDFTTGSLDSRINFSRTTNATVTNSAGVITYAPHNLLTYSEQFDNAAWVKNGATVTANNTSAPNNTTTADKITADGTTINQGVYSAASSIIGITYTFSVYLKGVVGGEEVQIGDASSRKTVTLTTSWVRYTTDAHSWLSANNIIYAKNNTAMSFYVWGAQLEIGSTATTYNSSTVKNLLGYSELFDNAAWTKSNSFVQTNLLTYSEAFDNAAWVNVGTTETANSVIAPNGYQTADTLIDTATTGRHSIYEAYTTSALTYTFSVYAKAGTLNYIKVGIATTGTTGVYFNLATGTKGTEDAGFTGAIENVGNGWYRCSITTLLTAAANYAQVMLSANGSDAGSYTGLGTGTAYIWGAQLVQGSVAGDYRRTDAAALPVYYPNHNGVVCAERIVPDSANVASHRISQTSPTITGGIYTYSIYAKADGYSWLKLRLNTIYANFNLSTGIVGVTNGISSSIQSLGNGWYRCSVTKTATGNNELAYCYVANSDNAGLDSDIYTGDGTSGIYIFGAQLSDSASLDPYVLNAAAAPTAAAYYGARFDYDPVTLAPKGLLIEEQRANLLLQSGFAGAVAGSPGTAPTSWSQIHILGTTNAITQDALGGNILSFTTVANRQVIAQTVAVSANTTYAASVYVNSNTGVVYSSIFQVPSVPAGTTVTYLANGVAITASSYVPVAGDRLSALIAVAGTAGNVVMRLGVGVVTTDTGTVSFSKPQVEAGAFATSYIPTAASQVTRAADVATINGSNFYSWYNQNEGSIVTNASALSTGFTFIARNSSGDSYVSTLNRASNNAFEVYNLNVAQTSLVSAALISKIAGGYKTNDFAASVNNSATATDTSGTTPLVSYASLGSFASNSLAINGTIKQISYYPQRLSNSVLKGLTA